jgi:hypothetical protein
MKVQIIEEIVAYDLQIEVCKQWDKRRMQENGVDFQMVKE